MKNVQSVKVIASKLRILVKTSALSVFLFSAVNAIAQEATLILRDGNVVTMNPDQPKAEAVVISGNTITFIGSSEEADNYRLPDTKVIDLNGLTLIPGLIESHAHFYGLGQSQLNVDLTQVANYEELIAKVKAASETAAPGDWIIGRGWHQSKWSPAPSPNVNGFQTHQALSAITPNNPVYLIHASGHAAFANAKAMEIAGVTKDSEFHDGGEIIKDVSGIPTGIFSENAAELIAKHIGPESEAKKQQSYKLAMDTALSYGITSFHDAGSSAYDLATFQQFGEQGKLKLRLYSMIDGHDQELVNAWLIKEPVIGAYDNFLTVRAIKLRADGALGSRGAWLLEDYSDRHGHRGSATVSMDELERISNEAVKQGYQMAVHAIGDRANREVLDKYETTFKKNNATGAEQRFRIEHAQHLSLEDIPRFAELDVIASMQSIHMSSDRPWAIDRLGQKRIDDGAYVWQKLLQQGVVIANGTDAPVEPVTPFANFYAAISRKTLAGTPEQGYEAEQKMTREQALRSLTIDGAYAAFEEDIIGSIEVGKLADMVILSQDLMTAPENAIQQTKALTTIVDGKIVFEQQP